MRRFNINVHSDLINNRFAYASVSRASQDAQIFTNAVSSLASSLGHAVNKTSAVTLEASLGV
jgi:bifunctional ADP-heptose synthase (sugar kinase/adenylyltransferase)